MNIKKLIIVESPTKIKTIKKFLNSEFAVNSCMGHIYKLKTSGSLSLGFDLETLKPDFTLLPEKKQTIKELKEQANNAEIVYIASDPDREGEAIAANLVHELKIENKYQRLEFNEITKTGITKALENPRELDTNLINSQTTRRFLDRVIGFRLSKVVDLKIGSKSAGRVQSVALKMLAKREAEIKQFVPQKYFNVIAEFQEEQFKTRLVSHHSKTIKFTSDEQIANLKKTLTNQFLVTDIKHKEITFKKPLPLITSTLIQKSPYSAARTMQLAQKLYEEGLITYMRTDSTRLSSIFVEQASKYIVHKFGSEYLNASQFQKTKQKNIQDAHEAIRITNIDLVAENLSKEFGEEHQKVYELIYKYSLGSLMANSKYQDKVVIFDNHDYQFQTTFRNLIFPGYLKLFKQEIKEQNNKKNPVNENEKEILNSNCQVNFNKGDEFTASNILYNEHFTKPPYRFNEGRIVKSLEKEGIGRPSTYSSILQRLLNSGYAYKYKGLYYITIRGNITNEFLQKYFSEEIQEKYTAEMEHALDLISTNELDYKEYLHKFIEYFLKKVDDTIEEAPYQNTIPLDMKCPQCQDGNLVIKKGYRGKPPFLGCSKYPDCRFLAPIWSLKEEKGEVSLEIVEKKPAIELDEECPKCGKKLVIRAKKNGDQFIGCYGYPKCRYVRSLEEKPKKTPIEEPKTS